MAATRGTLRTSIYPDIDPKSQGACLTGKVALVTGSSGGIGKAIANALALAGAHVAVNGRNAYTVEAAVHEISEHAVDSKVSGFIADVTSLSDQNRMVQEVNAQLGPIDILVCNAGTNLFQPFHQTNATEWWDQINLNVRAPVELTRIVIPQFKARNSGVIIYISSRAAVNHLPFSSAYSVSKAGISQFASCLQAELDIVQKHPAEGGFGENRIEIFSMHPGEIQTNLHITSLPLGLDKDAPYLVEMMEKLRKVLRVYPAELPAWTVVFLASGKAKALKGQYVDCTEDIGEVLERSGTTK